MTDDERIGRPITMTTQANIEMVCTVIDANPFSTYDDIQAETSLCHGTINHIMHDCLKMRKITARWVPHLFINQKRADRVRLCQNIWSNSETSIGD